MCPHDGSPRPVGRQYPVLCFPETFTPNPNHDRRLKSEKTFSINCIWLDIDAPSGSSPCRKHRRLCYSRFNVVKGRAELHASGRSSTMVIVWLAGLKPGSIHASHIHRGTFIQLSPGEISNDLSPVVANEHEVGFSKTEIPAKLADLADCSWWVAVHEGPVNATPQTPAIAVAPVITHSETRDETRGSKN